MSMVWHQAVTSNLGPRLFCGLAQQLGPLMVVERGELLEQRTRLLVADAPIDVLGHGLIDQGRLDALALPAIARGVAERLNTGGGILAAGAQEDEKERSAAHEGSIAQT